MGNITRWILDVRGIWEDQVSFHSSLQLAPEREPQILAFRHHCDRKMALGSFLLQKLWVYRHGVAWHDIHILKDDHGRPWWQTEADYNISHQDGFVVLAGRDDGRRIGIDIVSTQSPSSSSTRIDDFSEVFTAIEMKHIHAAADPYTEFMKRWAIKEAYVKATGSGLSKDFQQIEVQSIAVAQSSNYATITVNGLPEDREAADWQFELVHLDRMVIVTAVAPPIDTRGPFQWVSLDEIMNAAS